MYWSLRKRGVPEYLVKMIKATYKGARTRVRTEYGKADAFDIRVRVHQGSALSQFLFVTIMDTLSVEI